jgi:hypothetical protein
MVIDTVFPDWLVTGVCSKPSINVSEFRCISRKRLGSLPAWSQLSWLPPALNQAGYVETDVMKVM